MSGGSHGGSHGKGGKEAPKKVTKKDLESAITNFREWNHDLGNVVSGYKDVHRRALTNYLDALGRDEDGNPLHQNAYNDADTVLQAWRAVVGTYITYQGKVDKRSDIKDLLAHLEKLDPTKALSPKDKKALAIYELANRASGLDGRMWYKKLRNHARRKIAYDEEAHEESVGKYREKHIEEKASQASTHLVETLARDGAHKHVYEKTGAEAPDDGTIHTTQDLYQIITNWLSHDAKAQKEREATVVKAFPKKKGSYQAVGKYDKAA